MSKAAKAFHPGRGVYRSSYNNARRLASTENFAEQNTGRKKNETDDLLVIRGKSGRPIEGLSQYGLLDNGKPNQREVIFNRGKKFRVLSYRKLENGACGYEFEIEEI